MYDKIYKILDKNKYIRFVIDLMSYINRLIKVEEVSLNNLKNIENIKKMDIEESWFFKKKKIGISGVARLKNGDDFLEKVIESHLPFLDEIILIDNNSKDNTKKICLNLRKKYPHKIKFYEYKYDVQPPGENKGIKENSLESFVYFSNWCFSKSNFKYAMKIDDDNLFDYEKGLEIRKYILEKKPNRYITYWGYNLLKDKNGKLGISKENPYIGKYGDHGIFPVSKYTYFSKGYDNGGFNEKFNNRLLRKRIGFRFFHLKYLKKGFGLSNVKKVNGYDYFLSLAKKGETIKIKNNIFLNKIINEKILSND